MCACVMVCTCVCDRNSIHHFHLYSNHHPHSLHTHSYKSHSNTLALTHKLFTHTLSLLHSQGLLDLEGNLASTLVHLVKRDQNATNMLDTSTSAQEAMLKYV